MPFCTNCGSKLPAQVNYCPSCGASTGSASVSSEKVDTAEKKGVAAIGALANAVKSAGSAFSAGTKSGGKGPEKKKELYPLWSWRVDYRPPRVLGKTLTFILMSESGKPVATLNGHDEFFSYKVSIVDCMSGIEWRTNQNFRKIKSRAGAMTIEKSWGKYRVEPMGWTVSSSGGLFSSGCWSVFSKEGALLVRCSEKEMSFYGQVEDTRLYIIALLFMARGAIGEQTRQISANAGGEG